jgi:hypothetical protein
MAASFVLLREHNNNKTPKRWWTRQLFAGGHRRASRVGCPEVRWRIWIQEFYQDGSDMSFKNDWWQNIKREYKTFRRPHAEHSERTDALAVATPPNTSTLEMLRNVLSVNPIRGGTPGTCISAGSGQLRFFVAVLRGSSDSAETRPRNNESECALGITMPTAGHNTAQRGVFCNSEEFLVSCPTRHLQFRQKLQVARVPALSSICFPHCGSPNLKSSPLNDWRLI